MSKPSSKFDLSNALNQSSDGKQRDPFGEKDTNMYFASEEGNQQLALLEHLSRYSSLLSVVQGPQGSGKSRFMMEFARNQDETTIVSHVKSGMLMTATQLLKNIYDGFGKHIQAPTEASFGPLLKFAHDAEERSQATLILIDDAQELNTDAVTMLLDMMSLATDNQPVPHVVLFSEYPLSRNLDSHQRARYEKLTHSFSLAPYSLEQTRAYLLHRIRAVGGGISLPFSDKQVEKIHQESGGYPGKINDVASGMMGNGKRKRKFVPRFSLSMGFPLVHMSLLSLVMLGILFAVLFSDNSEENVPAEAAGNNVIPLSPRQGQTSEETLARMEALQRQIGQADVQALSPDAEQASQPIDLSVSLNNRTASQESLSDNVTPSPIAAAPLIATAPLAGSTEVVVETNQNSRVATSPFEKTQWWLEQNPNRYTLQLLGTHNEGTVKDFIREQGGIEEFSYFKSKHDNKDWFVVMYGLYRNRSEAIAAAETLPKDIRELNPWARSARGIQDDIRKSQ